MLVKTRCSIDSSGIEEGQATEGDSFAVTDPVRLFRMLKLCCSSVFLLVKIQCKLIPEFCHVSSISTDSRFSYFRPRHCAVLYEHCTEKGQNYLIGATNVENRTMSL